VSGGSGAAAAAAPAAAAAAVPAAAEADQLRAHSGDDRIPLLPTSPSLNRVMEGSQLQ